MKSYDVIVIGGGLMGTSTAYQLAKRGMKVAVVERSDLADGTASRTDGFVIFADKQPGVDALQGRHSVDLFKKLQKEFDDDMELESVDFMYVCESDFEMEHAAEYARKVTEQGIKMEVIDSKKLVEIEPNIAPDLAGGLWTTTDCLSCPYKVVFAFANESKKYGADFYPQTEVKAIMLDAKGNVAGVSTDKGDFLAPKVINCAGVWAPFIGKMVGLDIPIRPRKGILLITEKAEDVTRGMVLEFGYYLTKFHVHGYERDVSDLVKKHNIALNIATTQSGNTTVGGCRLLNRGYDIKTEYEIMQGISERAIRFFPVLEDMNCIRSFAGIRPYCLDHLPIVSAVEEVPGFYIAAGHEGDGVTLAAITGLLMAQIVSGEELEFPEAKELFWDRFKKPGYLDDFTEEADENL